MCRLALGPRREDRLTLIDRGIVKRLKGLSLGVGNLSRWALFVFLLVTLLSGQVRAAEEGTVEVSITPNPLAVSVFAPDKVVEGRHFTVRVQIQNLGDGKIRNTVATIHLDEEGLSLGRQKPERHVGAIGPHKVRTVRWRVKAVETGNYIVLVSVLGKGITGDLTAQDSITVTVKERGRFFNFLQRWYEVLVGSYRAGELPYAY